MPDTQDPRPADTPRVRRVTARKALGWSVGLLLVLAFAITLLAAWVSGTTAGLQTVARIVESSTQGAVRLEGVSGRIFDRLSIDRLRVELPDLRVEAEGLGLDWAPLKLLDEQLSLRALTARRIRLAARPSDASGGGLPDRIPLPLTIRIDRLELDEFVQHAWADAGFGEPRLRLTDAELQAEAGPRRIDIGALGVTLPWGRATATGHMGTASPYPLKLTATLDGRYEAYAYDVAATAEGELTRAQVRLKGHSQGVGFDLQAIATPFSPVTS